MINAKDLEQFMIKETCMMSQCIKMEVNFAIRY